MDTYTDSRYINTYTDTRIRILWYGCTDADIRMQIYGCGYTDTNIRIRVYRYTDTDADTDIRIRTYIYGYGYTNLSIRIRITGYWYTCTDIRIRIYRWIYGLMHRCGYIDTDKIRLTLVGRNGFLHPRRPRGGWYDPLAVSLLIELERREKTGVTGVTREREWYQNLRC